jgi:hypothetical protein
MYGIPIPQPHDSSQLKTDEISRNPIARRAARAMTSSLYLQAEWEVSRQTKFIPGRKNDVNSGREVNKDRYTVR